MREYIYAEYIKEKRGKHIYLGLLCIAIIFLQYGNNLYRILKEGGVLDVYCDNMQFHFFTTIIFILFYSIIIVYDEYKNNTMEQLSVVSLNYGNFVLSKLVMIWMFSFITMMIITLGNSILLAFLNYNVKGEEIFILLFINLCDSIILSILMVPIVLITVACRSNLILNIVVSTIFIASCFMINNLPISQNMCQKIMAYGHPLGSYAVIHNTIIYKCIPYKTSMILEPKENMWLSLISMVIYALVSFLIIKSVMKNNKGR